MSPILMFLVIYTLIGITLSLATIGIQLILDKFEVDSWWFCSEIEFLGINIVGWPISSSMNFGFLFLFTLAAAFKFIGCIFKAIGYRENGLGILRQAKVYFDEPYTGMSIWCQ